MKSIFEESLKGKTADQLNTLLEDALDGRNLAKTNQVLAAFRETGRQMLINPTNLDTTSEECAAVCARVKLLPPGRL